MKRAIGAVVLGLSACGYPLTQFVVRRWGVRGAAVAESVCAGLAIRDASMVARRRPGQASQGSGGAAAPGTRSRRCGFAGRAGPAAERAVGWPGGIGGDSAADSVRRAAVATLFAVHTIRFGIYLRADQGRRAPPPAGCQPGRSERGDDHEVIRTPYGQMPAYVAAPPAEGPGRAWSSFMISAG